MENKAITKKVGLRIRELRVERGLSLHDMSFNLNIEYNALIRIEKGRTNPTLKTLYNISMVLGVKLVDIVDVE